MTTKGTRKQQRRDESGEVAMIMLKWMLKSGNKENQKLRIGKGTT